MHDFAHSVCVDIDLIKKYDKSGPRYTSYPTAPHFVESFSRQDYLHEVEVVNRDHPDHPLSLYVHIPFCDTVCFYCACNKVVTKDRSRAVEYLKSLFAEIEMLGRLFPKEKSVVQLHLGGGTPTYLEMAQLTDLIVHLKKHFNLLADDSGEYGIEIDPREVPPGTIADLRKIGFNRISFGVQDLDATVQQAVNRIQPLDLDKRVVAEARESGFHSINLDLIYGLPHQTHTSFKQTLETVIEELDPDRLAIFNYAHLPQYFMPQRRINPEDLPSAYEKLRIMEATIHTMLGAGFVYIGMDHFAKPDNELALAQKQGLLHRNFQGYTTHGECDLIGLGSSAISQIGDVFVQNMKTIPEYLAATQRYEIPIARGLRRSFDDRVRNAVISRLICDFALDLDWIDRQFAIKAADYFQAELKQLQSMVTEGLLTHEKNLWRVTPVGKLLIRNICMTFDWYLANQDQNKEFSKTI